MINDLIRLAWIGWKQQFEMKTYLNDGFIYLIFLDNQLFTLQHSF